MPRGPVAELRPMILGSVPHASSFSDSRGNASPSDIVNTQTAAQAATTLRQLTLD